MKAKPQKTSDSYVAATRKLVDQFVSAYNKGSAAEVVSLFTESAVFMPPGEHTIHGREAIQSRFESFFEGFSYTIKLHTQEIDVVGDMLCERGKYTAYSYLKEIVQPPQGGAGEYLIVFERQADASWKISSWGTAAAKTATPSTMDSA